MVPADSGGIPPVPPYSGSRAAPFPFRLRASHPLRGAFPGASARFRSLPARPFYPGGASTPPVWAPPLSLATTRGITIVLFSCRYLDVSVRGVRPAFRRCPAFSRAGFPIRTPADHRPFAPPRGFSQLVASFLASESHRHPPCALLVFLFHSPPPPGRGGSCSLFPSLSMNSPGTAATPRPMPPKDKEEQTSISSTTKNFLWTFLPARKHAAPETGVQKYNKF